MNKLFETFDKINKTNTLKSNKYKKLMYEYEALLSFVENDKLLDESDNEKRRDVIELIRNNEFVNDPQGLYDSMKLNKHPKMLTFYPVSELSQMKVFKIPNYNIGYALKKRENGDSNNFDEIVAVHNSEDDVRGVVDELIQSAVKNGGCYLDHFDGFLSDVYSRNGFIEYKREDYNPQYDQDSTFKNKYGESDVVYRVHKSCKK